MAATTTSSSGHVVSKLQQTAEKLRLETTQLRERLRGERDAIRALRAQHAAELRSERATARRRHVELEAQINATKPVASATTAVVSACEQCAKLRACHDAELRRERCEHKKREAQLRTQLNEARRESTVTGAAESLTCQQCLRLSKDLVKQKELAKDIEERLQNVVEADKLKAVDLRAQHEKHVMEMSRTMRASKLDAHKMLEELKTKNRIIEQLKRSAGKMRYKGEETRGDGGGGGAENIQMRKLREDSRRTEQPALLPLEACDLKPDPTPLHNKFQDNVVDRSAAHKHNREQMTCGGPGDELEPTTEEDTDSAVSSAPSSLSPQPCSPLNEECGPLRCVMASRTSITLRDTPPPTSLSPQPSEGYTTPPLDMWTNDGDNDGVHYNNDDGRTENELTMAKRQVRELERALLMTRAAKSGRHVMALSERVRQLEDRESELLRELGDLREQNELLEFRVLELAECPDRPTMISDQWNEKQDACTGTDDEHLVNQLNEDPVRRRLLEMSRKTYDMEDKRCLLQVLMLLYGLDELSRRHKEGFTMDTNEEQMEQVQIPSQIITGGSRGTVRDRQPDRLVAKVPPFTGRSAESDDDRSTPVRVQEPSVPILNTRGTQTEKSTSTSRSDKEKEEEENEDARSLNLTAEVRKLDKLRETIEVVGNRNGRLVVSSGVVSSGSCSEQKHAHQLEFYRERVDVLERKVRVYESSGETQVRQLAERLNREVRLQAQVKQLTTAVQKLQTENSRLEEERCELEEAENDTRLRCQRLEAEVIQLERSKMSSKRRAREARNQATYWESMVGKYEERIYELEEVECDLRHRLEVMKDTSPVILLFNMWQKMQRNPEFDVAGEALDRFRRSENRGRSPTRSKSRSPQRRGCACSSANDKIKTLEEERDRLVNQKRTMELKVHDLETQMTKSKNTKDVQKSGSLVSINSTDMEMIKILQDLKERERDMKKRIGELEHRESAYMETLQQADDIWADMETKYKKRIEQAEKSESNMRDRLRRLEKREPVVDVGELEESERALSKRAERLERDNNRLTTENRRLERELKDLREESVRHADNVANRLGGDLDREKRRAQQLEGRLGEASASLRDAGNAHQVEVDALKERLSRTTNELVHLEVTNGELREEVDTLECKITEMEKAMKVRVTTDEQMIRGLSQELNERDRELAEMQKRERESAAATGERLGAALQSVKQCEVCSETVSPDLVETVEGVRTMCELVSCPTTRPPDDAQVSEGGDGLECTSSTCPEKLKQSAPSKTVSVYKTSSKTASAVVSQKFSAIISQKPSEVSVYKTSSKMASTVVSEQFSAVVSQKPSAVVPSVQVSAPKSSGVLSATLSAVKSIMKPMSAIPSAALLSVPIPSFLSKKSSVAKAVSFHAISDSNKVVPKESVKSGVLSIKSKTPSSAVMSQKPSVIKSGTRPVSVVASASKMTITTTESAVMSKTSAADEEKSITILAGIRSGAISSESFTASRRFSSLPSNPSIRSPAVVGTPYVSEVVSLDSETAPVVQTMTVITGDDDNVQVRDIAQISLSSASVAAVNTFTMAKSQGSTPSALRSGIPSAVRTKSTQSTKITADQANNLLVRNASRYGVSPSGVSARSGISVSTLSPSRATSSMVRQIESIADESGTSSITAVGSSLTESAISAKIASAFTSEMTRASDDVCDLVTEVGILGEPPYEELIAVIDLESGPTPEGYDVTATVTESGNLELETEGPPGIVEHTMTFTASGNLGVVTEFTPLPAATSGAIEQVPSYFHEGKERTGPDIKKLSRPLSTATFPIVGVPSAVVSKEASIAQLISQIREPKSLQIVTKPGSAPALISAVPSQVQASKQVSVAQMRKAESLQITTPIPSAISAVPSKIKAGKEASINNIITQMKGQKSYAPTSKQVSFPPSKTHLQVSSEKLIPAEKDNRSEEQLISVTSISVPLVIDASSIRSQELASRKFLGDVTKKYSELVVEERVKESKSQQKANVGVQCTCPVMRADKDGPQSSLYPTVPQQFNYNDILQLIPREPYPLANMEQVLCVCPVFQQQTNQQMPQCAPPPAPPPQMYGGPGQPFMNQQPGYFNPPAPYSQPPIFGAGYLPCPAFLPYPPPGYPPMSGQFPSPGFPVMNMQFPSSSYPPINQMARMPTYPHAFPPTAPMPFNLPFQHPQQAMYQCATMCPGPPAPRMPAPVPRPIPSAQNVQATRENNTAVGSNLCETYNCPVVLVQRQSIFKVAYSDAEAAAYKDKKAKRVEEVSKKPSAIIKLTASEQAVSKTVMQELYPSSNFIDHSADSSKVYFGGETAEESEPGSLLSVSLEFEFDAESDASLLASKNVSSSQVAIPASARAPSVQPSVTAKPSETGRVTHVKSVTSSPPKSSPPSKSSLKKPGSNVSSPTFEKTKRMLSSTSATSKRTLEERTSKVGLSGTQSQTSSKKSNVSFKSATSTISATMKPSPKQSAIVVQSVPSSTRPKSASPSKSIIPIIKSSQISGMGSPAIVSKVPSKQPSRAIMPSESPKRSSIMALKVPSRQPSRALTPRVSITSPTIASKAPSKQPSRAITPRVSTTGSPAIASRAPSKQPSRILAPKESTATTNIPSQTGVPRKAIQLPDAGPSSAVVQGVAAKESTPYHGKDCSCDTCKCRPCKDPKVTCVPREPKSEIDKKDSKKCPVCQCDVCRCRDCIDPSKKKKKDDVLSTTAREDTLQWHGPREVQDLRQTPPGARPEPSVPHITPPPAILGVTQDIPPPPTDPVKACDCEECACESCPDQKHLESKTSSKTKPSTDNSDKFSPQVTSSREKLPNLTTTLPDSQPVDSGHVDSSGPADTSSDLDDSTDLYTTAMSFDPRDLSDDRRAMNLNIQPDLTTTTVDSSYAREFVPILASTQATLPDLTLPPDTVTYDDTNFFPASSSIPEYTEFFPSRSNVEREPQTTILFVPASIVEDMTSEDIAAFEPILASTAMPSSDLPESFVPIIASTQATLPDLTEPPDSGTYDSTDFFPTSTSIQEPSASLVYMAPDSTVGTIASDADTEDFLPILDSTQLPLLSLTRTADFVPIVASTQLPPPNLTQTIDSSNISYTYNAPSQYGSSEPSSVPQHSDDVGLFGMMKGLGGPQPEPQVGVDTTQVKGKEPSKDTTPVIIRKSIYGPDRLGHPPDCNCELCECDPCKSNKPQASALVPFKKPADAESTLDVADMEKKRLPPSLIGPDFIKPTIRITPSQGTSAIPLGEKEALRPLAVMGAEEWRSLDTDTLKQRFIEMEKDAKQRVNEIAQIRKFMEGLKCACNQQLQKVQQEHPLVAPEPSRSFAATISGLQCALTFLQDKCQKKDRIIAAVTDELRLRAESGIFERVLQNVAAKKDDAPVLSFDRVAVSNALPKPDTVQRQVMRMPAEKPCATAGTAKKAAFPPNVGDVCCCDPTPGNLDPSPLVITELRRIAPDSILVKWERPASKHVKGYEVEVNGTTKSRVYSSGRTVAVLNGLQLDNLVQVSVYAVSVTGLRCQPPATAMYQGTTTRPATLTAEGKKAH